MPKAPLPRVYEGFPVVTAERMRALDREAGLKYGLTTEKLMENAGTAVAREVARFVSEELGRKISGARVVVCSGRGGKGGDGLVAARKLSEMGAKVAAFVCPPKEGAGYPGFLVENVRRASGAGVAVKTTEETADLPEALSGCDVVLDALLGTGSGGKPMGLVKDMIQGITRSKKPVLSVDLPSGLQPDTGYHSGVFVAARETYTLALPKRGLVAPHAQRNVGKLKVLDIGLPPELIEQVRAEVEGSGPDA